MYLVKNPSLLKKVFPSLLWKVNTKEKELYLTFDDGPHPVMTERLLAMLKTEGVPATFFIVGKMAVRHPARGSLGALLGKRRRVVGGAWARLRGCASWWMSTGRPGRRIARHLTG